MRVFKVAAIVAGLGLAQAGFADGKVEVDYRQAVMKSIGGHMSAIGVILKNQVHMGDLAFHSSGIAGLAEVAPEVFPEGSNVGKSKALDSVWEDPEGFAEAMDRFVEAADDMADAAKSGEMSLIGPAVQALGGSCKGCHDDYKEE